MSLFYVIAAGPSYMDITEEEWEFLSDKHTLTFTRVPYGSRKFEYYMSIERDYIDKSVLIYMVKLGYLDTKLLLSIPESIKLARELGFKSIRKILKQTFYFMPSRRPWFINESSPPHSFLESRAKNFHQPIFRFRGQLSAAINSALILGATEIRLIGVDLNNQLNFYQYDDILRKVCKDKETIDYYLQYNKEAYKQDLNDKEKQFEDFNPDTMHTTNVPLIDSTWNKPLRGIGDILKWMDKELRNEGLEGIYITNKNSLLYKENKLKYKSIMENQ
jgi:hypothetical protein